MPMARIWPAWNCASTLGSVEFETSMRPAINSVHQRRGAPERHMGHLGAGAGHEEFGRQMRAGADAGGPVIELAGIGLCEGDQLLHGLCREVIADHEYVLEGAGAGQGCEILDGVVAGLLQQEHVVAVRLVVAEHDRVAVGSARATGRVPTAPEAPPRFSTMTFWPRVLPISSATMRAITSVGPPAG